MRGAGASASLGCPGYLRWHLPQPAPWGSLARASTPASRHGPTVLTRLRLEGSSNARSAGRRWLSASRRENQSSRNLTISAAAPAWGGRGSGADDASELALVSEAGRSGGGSGTQPAVGRPAPRPGLQQDAP